MLLKDLIAYLETKDAALTLPHGFARPHSYRGDYYDLAFQPAENVTVGAMLSDARSCVGRTFGGYKGGDYTMGEYTDVFLAQWGETGDSLGPATLDAWFMAPAYQELVNVATGILECLEHDDTWTKAARKNAAESLRAALSKVGAL